MTRLPWTDGPGAALTAASLGTRDGGLDSEDAPGSPPSDAPIRKWNDFVPLAAALAWGAGAIHAVVTPEHFDESLAYGLFFVVAATAQFLWGAWAYCDPSRRVLKIGAIGSCVIATVWFLSRTIGAPVTLGSWQREPIEALDVLATVDELATAILIAAILGLRGAGRYAPTTSRLRLAAILVGVLVTASLLAPMLGANHHS